MSFFKSRQWRYVREQIIKRDLTFDLAVNNLYIYSKVFVHHINPITIKDIENQSSKLLDPENLITVSLDTHNIIHYGEIEILPDRRPGDTILW